MAYEKIMREAAGNEEAILRLFRFAGMIDSAIACASFRKSLGLWCVPDFDQAEKIVCQDLYHPLIKNAMKNDIVLGKNTVITGANASGKSTFMKAAAINVLLARTIHTCTAAKFSIPMIDVMSSMAIRDDIILGESYYIREIKYMKRMLDRLKRGGTVLFVIDEIMRGTNQREGLAISEALLGFFADKQCFVIAATHDVVLLQKLRDKYRCCHFEYRLNEGRITFDYKIRQGAGGGSNAVNLLAMFEYPEEIIDHTKQILTDGG